MTAADPASKKQRNQRGSYLPLTTTSMQRAALVASGGGVRVYATAARSYATLPVVRRLILRRQRDLAERDTTRPDAHPDAVWPSIASSFDSK